MYKLIKTLTLFTALMICSTLAIAGDESSNNCDESLTVDLGLLGKLVSASLHSMINVKHEALKKIRHPVGLRSREATTLKQQLMLLENAEQDLINKMYLRGCNVDLDKVSLKTRVERLERKVQFVH